MFAFPDYRAVLIKAAFLVPIKGYALVTYVDTSIFNFMVLPYVYIALTYLIV